MIVLFFSFKLIFKELFERNRLNKLFLAVFNSFKRRFLLRTCFFWCFWENELKIQVFFNCRWGVENIIAVGIALYFNSFNKKIHNANFNRIGCWFKFSVNHLANNCLNIENSIAFKFSIKANCYCSAINLSVVFNFIFRSVKV